MPSKDKTSVVLTELSQKLKNAMAPIYGLKNMLSAGVWLFDKLSAEQREYVIGVVLGRSETAIDQIKSAADALGAATHTRILSPQEVKLLHDLQKSLAPDKPEKTKSKSG